MAHPELILIRHAQSVWNLQNRFSGWTDVPLTEQGIGEAQCAARVLQMHNYHFDRGMASMLKRADHTLHIILTELGLSAIPVERTWRLNERHYGALQGLNKTTMAKLYGDAQVFQWRRGVHSQPPALQADDPRHPRYDDKYQRLDPAELPASETLATTLQRLLPYWHERIKPRIAAGQRLIVSAHGNTLRALVMYLDQLPDKTVESFEIPTATPLVYRFDPRLRPIARHYLTADGQQALAVA